MGTRESEPLLTVKEAAGELRVSLPTIYRRIAEGDLEALPRRDALRQGDDRRLVA